MKLSVVIPVFNGEKTIASLVEQLFIDLKGIEFEVILINDGSSDNSEEQCEVITKANKNIKFLSLRRNFGEHNAVLCGLSFASGQFAVIIDDDFQNPPSEILILLNEIEKGYDVVYSKFHRKKHHFFRNLFGRIHNSIANILMYKPRDLYLSSFKIISKEIVDEIIKYKGPFPYIDGLIIRTTNNISSTYVAHNKRETGKSNYTVKKLFSLYLNMFLNFSIKPLRIFTISGLLIFFIGIILSVYFIISKFVYMEPPGWTSTVLFIILFSGFQIIFLGLIGEYLGKQYLDQNNTPQWLIKKKIIND